MRAAQMIAGLLSFLVPVVAQTACQSCCAPGGDCSKAYKGGPGQCCGEAAGNSFCCPTRNNEMGAAKCWHCVNDDVIKCYQTNTPPRCGGQRSTYGVNETTSLVILVVSMLAIGMAVSACMRHRRQLPLHAQGVQDMQMAAMHTGRAGQPMQGAQPGMPVGTVVGCHPGGGVYPGGGCYPAQSGYGGGTVAAGAGMGFLGGMMVSDMMHHGGGYGGGGGYGEGGGYGDGGGDMGGDFSADM